MKIGNIELENNVILAPMAGITDIPFRLICKNMGCGLVYSEMVSAKGILYNNENTKVLMRVEKLEHPIVIQFFGSEPEVIGETIKRTEHLDMDIIDLNFGCPATKIFKNSEGSALMKTPKLIGEIVNAAVKATKKPITVKIRKGINNFSVNAVEVAKICEYNGAKAIAVHGRTREEYYSGIADWEIIAKVKQAVKIPVIGNGDITSAEKAKKMLDETGCDAIMIGRGALGNPWIFKRSIKYLKEKILIEEPTIAERMEIALKHCHLIMNYKGEYIASREMRKHLAWYTKGIADSAKLRKEINSMVSFDDMEKLVLKISKFEEKNTAI